MTADEIIAALDLQPHPEGGFYRETFRDDRTDGRAHSTAIYFLLKAGEASHWHRVTDASEVWHLYAGASLALDISENGATSVTHVLGIDIARGERPQVVVPANCWQAARSLGDRSLAGCTVAPGFLFDSFEMAPPDWSPGSR
jgi:predicted cupin superfamily sugar epimerase